jgi:hypothetical protein
MSNDEVIEHLNIQQFTSIHELLRGAHIFSARLWVTAGVIVHHDNSCAITPDSFPEDISWLHINAGKCDLIDLMNRDDIVASAQLPI